MTSYLTLHLASGEIRQALLQDAKVGSEIVCSYGDTFAHGWNPMMTYGLNSLHPARDRLVRVHEPVAEPLRGAYGRSRREFMNGERPQCHRQPIERLRLVYLGRVADKGLCIGHGSLSISHLLYCDFAQGNEGLKALRLSSLLVV